jgi:hypothetical protein
MILSNRVQYFKSLLGLLLSTLALVGCRDSCQSSEVCRLQGTCKSLALPDGRSVCIASSDDECRQSVSCKDEGRCTWDGRTGCQAIDPTDCKSASVCIVAGQCTVVNGECKATSQRDCEKSSLCSGCGLLAAEGICVRVIPLGEKKVRLEEVGPADEPWFQRRKKDLDR